MIGTSETAFILFFFCFRHADRSSQVPKCVMETSLWRSMLALGRHLPVTQTVCVCVFARACPCARMLERQTPDKHTVARCASELPYIFWSGAFISTLLNVSAGKVSSFDALRSPLISQKCHPVVMTEAIALSPEQICCANNSEEQRSWIICTYPKKKWMTQGWLLDSRQP